MSVTGQLCILYFCTGIKFKVDFIQTGGGHVWWIISRIDSGPVPLIQVVISDDADGENAVKVGYKLKEELQKGITFYIIYSIAGYNSRKFGCVNVVCITYEV